MSRHAQAGGKRQWETPVLLFLDILDMRNRAMGECHLGSKLLGFFGLQLCLCTATSRMVIRPRYACRRRSAKLTQSFSAVDSRWVRASQCQRPEAQAGLFCSFASCWLARRYSTSPIVSAVNPEAVAKEGAPLTCLRGREGPSTDGIRKAQRTILDGVKI
ncbi:uncharacterized protein BO80DRAFT_96007 [Aspergillus ibericus CBS 121593]|uniref:Uncharacterized protein n=1 Tax=Aspergillus ibericus CBS 121593 TaxID=1448316 RepID=A0A395GYQ6_9EURO|nr:hypothetical protein BO80DRAFT_96007 [Aspergillus ibericus CBS 121593]RAL00717.1 hypothetical protein BO80DRAFT_96007 [Aspergillus ibericus CBS 121593]